MNSAVVAANKTIPALHSVNRRLAKPAPADALLSRKVISSISLSPDLLHPWRRKYKRVEVDPAQGKVVAIRMYEPPLGVS